MVYYGRGRKTAKPGKKTYRKKRFFKRSTGVKKLANAVRILKRQVAGEKKTINALLPGTLLGQCNINGDATFSLDCTPRPPQGDGYSQRNGRQIKCVAMSLQWQVVQQPNTNHPIRIKFYLVKVVGTPLNSIVAYQNFMLSNPITGVRDHQATRDINYWKDYRVIKSWSTTLAQDQATGNLSVRTGRVACKMNHFVNFDGNTTSVNDGQLLLMAFADSGNCGTSNSTLPNVVVQTYATGCVVQTYAKWFYTDN